MTRFLQLLILLVIGAVAFEIWWIFFRVPPSTDNRQAVAAASQSAPAAPSSWTGKGKGFSNEQEWLVNETAANIANILVHSKGAVPPAVNVSTKGGGEANRYEIVVDPEKSPVSTTLQHYVWAEENYVPLANQLIRSWGLKPPQPARFEETLLAKLLTPEPSVLVREGKRVTENLNDEPLSPDANEEAALLLGTLGLRENCDCFGDVRATLCRMAAHLAVARSVRAESGPDGVMASIILLTLSGRQAEAVEKLSPLEKTQPAWVNALKLRNTGDWRILPQPKEASLLERLEWFRAAADSVNVDFALKGLPGVLGDTRPDWSHIVMGQNYSVENGHRFVVDSVPMEMREVGTTWGAIFNKTLIENEMVQQLNVSPLMAMPLKSDSKLQVLGWPDWAAYYQRHICEGIYKTFFFLNEQWGVPEYSKKFVPQMDRYFMGLTLYPIEQKLCAFKAEDAGSGLKRSVDLCANHPELISVTNWIFLNEEKPFHVDTKEIPDSHQWFTKPFLFGTAYEYRQRCTGLGAYRHGEKFEPDAYPKIAPYDFHLLYNNATNKYGTSPTAQQWQDTYRGLAEYNLYALWQLSRVVEDSPEEYVKIMGRICELSPDNYNNLAYYFVKNNRPEDAAAAYRNAFEKATDRVSMANSSRWIVDYDFDHGKKQEAEEIAADAAKVYSFTGLETMAWLQEREGNMDAAEDYYGKIRERYEDTGPLAAFYFRNKEKVARYSRPYEDITKSIFPGGMEKAALADFKDAPVDGALVKGDSYSLRSNGLKVGDVMVAIEGFRVHNFQQYSFVRGMESDPHFTLIVWSNGAYRQVNANAENRRFACDMGDFKKP